MHSGPAKLTKTDAGTLILVGNNIYTGGTTIEDGTLQFGNGGMTGKRGGQHYGQCRTRFQS
jgi:fibronectin-binding autotransporter adhesin